MWPATIRTSVATRSTVRYISKKARPLSRPASRKPLPPGHLTQNGRQEPAQNDTNQHAATGTEQERLNSLSATLHDTNPQDNSLLAPVHIPEDPNAVLKERHPAAAILANSGLVVERQFEMMNVLLGFEQANRYVILDPQGNHVGYMAERDGGMGSMVMRQSFRTHRSFVTHVFDRHQNEVLRFHRPFSWINSQIRVYDPLEVADSAQSPFTGLQTVPGGEVTTQTTTETAKISPLHLSEMRLVGEAQQQWAPFRRKYNLFLFHSNPDPATNMGAQRLPTDLSGSQQLQVAKDSMGEFAQFGYVDERFMSWDFSVLSADSRLLGSVNRNFSGFVRDILTDTGVYALRMDSAALAEEKQKRHLISQTHKTGPDEKTMGMSLDQRAVMLATAVSIDFDYFSRHSGSTGGFFPFPFFGFGGGAAEGAATGGAVEGAAAGGALEGAATGGVESLPGAAAGAGTMAGYEVMREHMGHPPQEPRQQPPVEGGEEVWGEHHDTWAEKPGDSQPPSGGDTGTEGGGGDADWSDFF